jgi:hypothetical protein
LDVPSAEGTLRTPNSLDRAWAKCLAHAKITVPPDGNAGATSLVRAEVAGRQAPASRFLVEKRRERRAPFTPTSMRLVPSFRPRRWE